MEQVKLKVRDICHGDRVAARDGSSPAIEPYLLSG
jgi:hypothetical protein